MTKIQPEQIFNQYKDSLASLKIDLSSVPFANKAAMAIKVADAKSNAPMLKQMFLSHLYETAFSLYLKGNPDKQEKFCQIIEETFENIVVLDGSAMYREFCNTVNPSIGARQQFGPTQLVLLTNALETELRKTDTILFSAPQLEDVVICKNIEDVTDQCRILTEKANGFEPLRLNLEQTATEKALNRDTFDKQTLYVIKYMNSGVDKFGPVFLGGRYRECNVDEMSSITVETVLEVLNKIKKSKS